jgi:hypothetical protein
MRSTAPPSGVTSNALAQAVSSLSNVVVSIMVARHVSANSFGTFSVLVSTFVLSCGLGRALVGEPLLALLPSADTDRVRGVVGAALTCGAVLALIVVSASLALASGDARAMLALLALALPLLLVEDACRYVCFARGRPLWACGLDLVWLVLASAGIVLVGHEGGVTAFASVWLASGCVAGALGWAIVAPHRPSGTSAAIRWLRPLGSRYGVEFMTSGALVALPVYVLAMWASPADAGGFRAALTLLGPTNVAFAAIATYFVPLANKQRLSADDVVRGAGRMAAVVSAVVLVWAVALVALPTAWLAVLIGDSAGVAERCLPALGSASVLLTIAGGAVVGHRALRAAPRSLRVRLWLAPVGVILPVAGVHAAGLTGVLAAVVAFACLSAVLWWASLVRIDRRTSVQAVAV